MDIFQVKDLFEDLYEELDDNEVLRIELINGTKLYCLQCDVVFIDNNTGMVGINKSIKKDKRQHIRIDPKAIAVICTMSRQTYEAKLKRGELYV